MKGLRAALFRILFPTDVNRLPDYDGAARRQVHNWIYQNGGACMLHRPVVRAVQHLDLPIQNAPDSKPVSHTMVLTRCEACGVASGYSLIGRWSLADVTSQASPKAEVDRLLGQGGKP